jgi:serine/threonine protein kinase
MASNQAKTADREQWLDEVLGAYYEALEAGEAIDPRTLIERHPELADDLAAYFRNEVRFRLSTLPTARFGPEERTLAASAPGDFDTPDAQAQTKAQTIEPVSVIKPGDRFDDYELIAEIARGGMGVVYRARQLSVNRIVALKMLLGGQFASPTAVQRFHIEADAVAHLDHPNIVPIHFVGEYRGQPYYSMKLMEGGSPVAWMPRPADDPRTVAQMVVKIARAIHHAHQRGILHRDLKPSNILLDAEGEPHVSDFGLAKRIDVDGLPTGSGTFEIPVLSTTSGNWSAAALERTQASDSRGPGDSAELDELTLPGEPVGSPSYMAPEQASRGRMAVTTATDVYGLGAILYAILTGRAPFKGESFEKTLELVRTRRPDPPSTLNPRVDRNLEAICLRCLEKNPARRYISAESVARDLERWLADLPVRARRAGLGERLRLWVRRRPTLAAMSAALVLITALGLFGVSWLWRHNLRTQRQRAKAQAQFLVWATPDAFELLQEESQACRAEFVAVLRALRRDPTLDEMQRARIAAALLPEEPDQIAFLREALLQADPYTLAIIRDALAAHDPDLARELWRRVEDPRGDGARRFRAACALAPLDPKSPRWSRSAEDIAARLVVENPATVDEWAKVLQPIQPVLVGPLEAIYRDPKRPQERDVAALALAEFAADDFDELSSLFAQADSTQIGLFAAKLRRYGQRTIAMLDTILQTAPAPGMSEADRDRLIQRQGNAALALLRLGHADRFWPLLRAGAEPRLRTYLIHHVAAAGVDPKLITAWLPLEFDPAAKAALIQILGEYSPHQLLPSLRRLLVPELIASTRHDPNPEVHEALDRLLTRWGHPGSLR